MALRYEPLTSAHAPLLFPVLSPELVWAHIAGSEERTLEEMAARYARVARGPSPERVGERWVNFALRLPDGACCGRIEATIHDSDDKAPWAEIAYLLGPAYWGRGLAQEAVGWLVAYLAGRRVYELWAAVQPNNARSRRLLLRLGFREAPTGVRSLLSEDEGDLLFRHGP